VREFLSVIYYQGQVNNKGSELYSEYTTILFKHMFDAQASARENLECAKISKRYYDCKANP